MRAQVLLEFLFILALALTIGITYLALSADLFHDRSEQQRTAVLNDVGFQIQDELLLAASVEDGYARNFTIPLMADRFDYSITNDATSVTLTSGLTTITYSLPAFAGNLSKGTNMVKKNGNITVNS
jgi:electron transfer flavoprotein alpha subunit